MCPRSMVTGLHNPKGTWYVTVTAPVVLRKLDEAEKPVLGFIYGGYKALIDSVGAERYG